MSVTTEVVTKHIYRANIGMVEWWEEAGTARVEVNTIQTRHSNYLREFAQLLISVAEKMESGEAGESQ